MPEDERDFMEFDNPVWREIFRRSAGEEELKELCAGFMRGNWSLFGMVAPLLLEGRRLTGFEGEKSPHAEFWSQYSAQATEDEKREFIGFLLRAQLANSCIKSRPGRVQVAGFTGHCRRALLDYLSEFQESVHAPNPKTLLGAEILRYSYLPDERMVQLAGMFAMAEAIPALERFLRIKRRFHQLFTDYGTSPHEVDSVFVETVRALVRIALADEKERDKVLDILKAATKEAKRGEKVWFEAFYARHRGYESQDVEERDISQVGMPTKVDLLKVGIKAIQRDGEERRSIDGREFKKEPYSWVIPGPDGQGKIVDDRLYMLGDFKLEAVDITTGYSIFKVETYGYGSTGDGVGCYYPILVTSDRGTPILVTLLDNRSADLKEVHAIRFDRDTGEVKSMFKLCFHPIRAWGPEVWPRPDDGVVFRMREEKMLWKQDKDGDLVWKKDLEEWAVVRNCQHHLAILTEAGLLLLDTEDGKTRGKRTYKGLLEDAGVEGTYRDDMVMTEEGFFIITREGELLFFDHGGEFEWKGKAEEGGSYLTELRPWMGGLVGENNDYFYRFTKDGDVSYFKKPDKNIKSRLINTHGVFFMAESYGIVDYHSFETGETKELLKDLPIVKSLGDASNDHFVIRFFEDTHFWACLPKDKW